MIEILTLIVEIGILILLAIEVYMGYWQMRALKRIEAKNAISDVNIAGIDYSYSTAIVGQRIEVKKSA